MIKQGDTLAKICMQYYGSLSKMGEVCERNQIENKDSIYYGQKKLRITRSFSQHFIINLL